MKRLAVIALLAAFSLGHISAAEDKAMKRVSAVARKTMGDLPLGFELNRGQTQAEFAFVGTSTSANVYLKSTGAALLLPRRDSLNGTRLNLSFTGSNPNARGQVEDLIPGFTYSYLIGSDPAKWIQGLRKYAKVRYHNVWPGIDLVYYGNKHHLEYDFIVAPGKRASDIRLRLSGADSVSLTAAGDLEFNTSAGVVIQRAPDIYQYISGQRSKVHGHYVVTGQEISFAIAKYDRSQPLIIDPMLVYSIPGLPLSSAGYGIAVDKSLAAYAVGATVPLQQANSTFRTTAYMYKIATSGAVAGFSFGTGTGDTVAKAVAVDGSGNVYMTGSTSASDLTSAGFQPTFGDVPGSGLTDAFFVKFSPPNSSGISSSLYSTYIGGTGNDVGNAIAVDITGKAYIAGTTSAANFPTTAGSPSYRASGSTAFVVKIDPAFPAAGDLRSRVYSTLVGGTGTDTASSIVVEPTFTAYVAGTTTSTSASFLPSSSTGFNVLKTTAFPDGFLIKLNPNGISASYLTFLINSPINGITQGLADGFIYATGQTTGALPTNSVNAGYQVSTQGGLDAFLVKFDTTTNGVNSLLYSTYLGGVSNDLGYAVGVDQNGNASIIGTTNSSNFPATTSAFTPAPNGLPDAFVSRINTTGSGPSTLIFSARIGGDASDDARGGVVDLINNVYLTGITSSTNFPTTAGQSGTGAFASKLQVICASKAGVFRNGATWVLDANGNTLFDGTAAGNDIVTNFGGIAGDIPVYGDWNGDGRTKIGVYRPASGTWVLDFNGNGQFDGTIVDRVYTFGGASGDLPVVGDWNGDGRSKIGIFRAGYFWVLDFNGNGTFEQGIDKSFPFGGAAGDVPVVGDWTGTGTTKVGLFRAGFYWVLDANGNQILDGINQPGGDLAFAYGGAQGDIPVVGDWNGTGFSKAGLFRAGYFWVLDANGNRLFDQGIDFTFPFGGISGDVPVGGCWR